MASTEEIKELIENNELEAALERVEERLANDENDDMAYFLKGMICWKDNDWAGTIENYHKAMELNPDGPGGEALVITMQIINFSNPQIFNL